MGSFGSIVGHFSSVSAIISLFNKDNLLSRIFGHRQPSMEIICGSFSRCDRHLTGIVAAGRVLTELQPLLTIIPSGGGIPSSLQGRVLDVISRCTSGNFISCVALDSSLLFDKG